VKGQYLLWASYACILASLDMRNSGIQYLFSFTASKSGMRWSCKSKKSQFILHINISQLNEKFMKDPINIRHTESMISSLFLLTHCISLADPSFWNDPLLPRVVIITPFLYKTHFIHCFHQSVLLSMQRYKKLYLWLFPSKPKSFDGQHCLYLSSPKSK
jgi:hypothetical protein